MNFTNSINGNLSLWQASSSLSPNNLIGSPLSLNRRITFKNDESVSVKDDEIIFCFSCVKPNTGYYKVLENVLCIKAMSGISCGCLDTSGN